LLVFALRCIRQHDHGIFTKMETQIPTIYLQKGNISFDNIHIQMHQANVFTMELSLKWTENPVYYLSPKTDELHHRCCCLNLPLLMLKTNKLEC
jgi:hypothetical protein